MQNLLFESVSVSYDLCCSLSRSRSLSADLGIGEPKEEVVFELLDASPVALHFFHQRQPLLLQLLLLLITRATHKHVEAACSSHYRDFIDAVKLKSGATVPT